MVKTQILPRKSLFLQIFDNCKVCVRHAWVLEKSLHCVRTCLDYLGGFRAAVGALLCTARKHTCVVNTTTPNEDPKWTDTRPLASLRSRGCNASNLARYLCGLPTNRVQLADFQLGLSTCIFDTWGCATWTFDLHIRHMGLRKSMGISDLPTFNLHFRHMGFPTFRLSKCKLKIGNLEISVVFQLFFNLHFRHGVGKTRRDFAFCCLGRFLVFFLFV